MRRQLSWQKGIECILPILDFVGLWLHFSIGEMPFWLSLAYGGVWGGGVSLHYNASWRASMSFWNFVSARIPEGYGGYVFCSFCKTFFQSLRLVGAFCGKASALGDSPWEGPAKQNGGPRRGESPSAFVEFRGPPSETG